MWYPSGSLAHVHLSWLSPVKVRRTMISGSLKMAVWDDVEPTEKIYIYDKGVVLDPSSSTLQQQMVSYRLGDLHVPLVDNREALGKLVRICGRNSQWFGDALGRRFRCRRRARDRSRTAFGGLGWGEGRGVTTDSAPLRFSLLLPVFNEAARLPALLESIRRQRYPSECVELLIADGGSSDDTVAIAQRYGARVFHNPIRRAEPGAGMLLEKASGDVAMWLAADNVFAGDRFLERMARPFADPRITAAFPSLVSTARDGGTARYFNAFTDPFNHFVYGGATSPASYHRTYRVKRRTDEYVVYDFASGPRPLIALAQAFTTRLPYRKPARHRRRRRRAGRDAARPRRAKSHSSKARHSSIIRCATSAMRCASSALASTSG